jgi:exosortase K
METGKNTGYYFAAAGIFVLLKAGFTFAGNDSLAFLLNPTDKLVGLLAGSHSVYIAAAGYFHDSLNIVIDKSCSGFNFWILCFLLFTYLTVKRLDKPLHKTLAVPVSLICAYPLTIFANVSRIFASLIVESHTKNFFPERQYLIHEAIGIITYLSFLILAFFLIEKLKRGKYNAELP